MNLIVISLQQAALFFPLALGIYLSYRILKVTDLTVEGSFVLGAAVFAQALQITQQPIISLFASIISGCIAGIGVASIQYKKKESSLLAGILAIFILYSINFQVMGKPNISLLGKKTLISFLNNLNSPVSLSWILIFAVAAIAIIFLTILLRSQIGLQLRATGLNYDLVDRLGQNPEKFKFIGLGLSNSLASLCGSLNAQIYGYADINMGVGMAIVGIGTVVLGIQIFGKILYTKKFNPALEIFSITLSVFLYFLAINQFMRMGINPINIKLLIGLFLIFFLRAADNHESAHE